MSGNPKRDLAATGSILIVFWNSKLAKRRQLLLVDSGKVRRPSKKRRSTFTSPDNAIVVADRMAELHKNIHSLRNNLFRKMSFEQKFWSKKNPND